MMSAESNIISGIKKYSTVQYVAGAIGIFFIFMGWFADFNWLQVFIPTDKMEKYALVFEILNQSKWFPLCIGLFLLLCSFTRTMKILMEFDPIDLIILSFIAVILFLYFISSQIRHMDADEYEHMHKAWLMREHTIPYYSFRFLHSPFIEWVIILFMNIQKESVFIIQSMRSAMFMISCASLGLIYLIVKRLFESRLHGLACVLMVLCNHIWITSSPEVRPDNIMLFFALLSFLVLMKYDETRKPVYMLIFMICAVLSFLGKQNAAIFYFSLGIIYIYQIMVSHFSNKIKITFLLISMSSIFLFFSIIPHEILRDLGFKHLIPNSIKFWPIDYLWDILIWSPAIFIFFIVQCISIKKLRLTHSISKFYIISISIGCFLFLFLMNRPWPQEMLVMIIFMGILGSNILVNILKELNIKESVALLLLIILPASNHLIVTNLFKKTLLEDFKTTRTILEITKKDDLVFDTYGKAIFRPNPLDPRFLQFFPARFYKLEALKNSKLKFLIKDDYYYPRFPKKTLKWFHKNFIPINDNPNIFIRKYE